MPYKYTGDYYGRKAVGDYYAAQGDPFLGAALGLIGGKVLPKLAGGLIKGGAKLLGRGGGSKLATGVGVGTTVMGASLPFITPSVVPAGKVPVPGLKGKLQRLLPGGKTGFMKRRTMNTLNPKALSRATRRLKGFHARACSALNQLGYKVVRSGVARGSRSCKRKGPC